jgi:DNA-binding transcriptional ArsR family regulator
MIESMSGFLAPEQRIAMARRRASSETAASTDLSLAILKVLLASDAPLTVSDLLGKVHASSRSVVAALDELTESGLVICRRLDTDPTHRDDQCHGVGRGGSC